MQQGKQTARRKKYPKRGDRLVHAFFYFTTKDKNFSAFLQFCSGLSTAKTSEYDGDGMLHAEYLSYLQPVG